MKHLIAVLCTAWLCACATQTQYVAAGSDRDYGYSETGLTDSRYRVNFSGNSRTSSDEVKDMALLRAAELTLLNGYNWFRVVNQETEQNVTSQQTNTASAIPPRVVSNCGLLGCTSRVTPGYSGAQIVTSRDVDRYTTSIEIVMGKGELQDPASAYNAREIRDSLEARY